MKKSYLDLQEFVQTLESSGELLRISKEIDPFLEISELYLRHARSEGGGKALLFENVKGSSIPVLINTFGSFRRMALSFGSHTYEDYAKEILGLLDLSVPQSFIGKISKGISMLPILKYPPRKVSRPAPCQEIVLTGDQVDLGLLPIMTSWPMDGGPFITLPLVFTRSLDGKKENMGLYRMHVYDRNTTGMHWQTHKDGSHFYSEYRKANKRMPVAVAIGADPATVYSGTAPLPAGIFELLFAGFLRGTGVPMVPCKTIDLSVPANAEIILEGYVEPDEMRDEGPFGDHTGY